MSGGNSAESRAATDAATDTRRHAGDGVAVQLERHAARLSELAAGDPTSEQADAVVLAVAELLPDERAADLLDEVARVDVAPTLRAAAAQQLVRHGLLQLEDPLVRRLLAEVGPPARLALAQGLHDRGDHESARGLVRPLMRAVHNEVRQQAQLLYRSGPQDYVAMRTDDIVRDAEEPGWLHRAWAGRELLRRGELDKALKVLDTVVGSWNYFGDDDSRDEPARVVAALAADRDDPRARLLLERALADPLPEVRVAAADAFGVPAPRDEPDIDLSALETDEARTEGRAAGGRRLLGRNRG